MSERATSHRPIVDDGDLQLYQGDAEAVLASLDAGSVQTCVTSPPYWGLRDYGTGDSQIGLEATPAEYVERMVSVFREVWRVLRDDGTVWLNLGDSYNSGAQFNGNARKDGTKDVNGNQYQERTEGWPGHRALVPGLKPKDLVGVPWRVAFALQADGWYLRSDIIWSKPNPMPESVTDRPTKAHEYLFLLAKSQRYFYNAEAIRERATYYGPNGANGSRPDSPHAGQMKARSGNKQRKPNPAAVLGQGDTKHGIIPWEGYDRNRRTVWEVPTMPFPEAHFATFPEALVSPCIQAGSREGDVVLDPFMGSGTTALVTRRLGRRCIGVELNPDYIEIATRRTQQLGLLGGAA